MPELPLPPVLRPFVDLVAAPPGTSPSLLFNRAFDRYDHHWTIQAGENQKFLEAFRNRYSSRPADFDPFVERRRKALEESGTTAVRRYNQTRLVIGLGLPHPTETALLLDRLTGCPYVPGSSVKGVLRAAARLVAAGELTAGEGGEGDRTFWSGNLDRLFGPELGGEATPAKGELRVYDAFPATWPKLELDVLTPHYAEYYSDDGATKPPADWLDPNPVSFLTVQAGTAFTFWLGHARPAGGASDLAAAVRLLDAALEWLGLGGKTSSGYGVFASGAPAGPKSVDPSAPEPEDLVGAPPPDPDEVLWRNAELYLDRALPTVEGPEGAKVRDLGGAVPEALRLRLERGDVLTVDARVKKTHGGRWALIAVRLP